MLRVPAIHGSTGRHSYLGTVLYMYMYGRVCTAPHGTRKPYTVYAARREADDRGLQVAQVVHHHMLPEEDVADEEVLRNVFERAHTQLAWEGDRAE